MRCFVFAENLSTTNRGKKKYGIAVRLTLPLLLRREKKEEMTCSTIFLFNITGEFLEEKKILELLGNVQGHGRREKKRGLSFLSRKQSSEHVFPNV